MSVHFNRGRLHVGYRARDWSDVWYEPIGEVDPNEGAFIGLFSFANGDKREHSQIMEGEIHWHPPFDVHHCESRVKRERYIMQNRFLASAHVYLKLRDPAKLKKLEREWDCQDFSRWQVWFRKAKVWKRRQLKDLNRRRAKITNNGGIPCDMTDEESEDDSTYDSEDQRAGGTTAKATMPPPKEKPGPRSNSTRGPQALRSMATKTPRTDPGPSSHKTTPRTGVTNGEKVESDYSSDDDDDGNEDGNQVPMRPKPSNPPPGPAPSSSVGDRDFGGLGASTSSRLSRLGQQIAQRARETETRGDREVFEGNSKSESDLNAGLDEEEAFQEAIRRSEAPEDLSRRTTDGFNGEVDDVEEAIRHNETRGQSEPYLRRNEDSESYSRGNNTRGCSEP